METPSGAQQVGAVGMETPSRAHLAVSGGMTPNVPTTAAPTAEMVAASAAHLEEPHRMGTASAAHLALIAKWPTLVYEQGTN